MRQPNNGSQSQNNINTENTIHLQLYIIYIFLFKLSIMAPILIKGRPLINNLHPMAELLLLNNYEKWKKCSKDVIPSKNTHSLMDIKV